MTGEIAAVGDVAAGMLTARAIEPDAGEAHHGAASGLCLNCGTRLLGEHCHACGQSAHVHRTVGAIGHELAHGVFHFEGKVFRTLPLLFFRPGELTRRYVAGERARFVSPLALFLFSVFLMFAAMSAFGPVDLGKGLGSGFTGAEKAVVQGQENAREEIGRLERRRAAALAAGQPVAAIDKRLAQQRDDLRVLDNAQRSIRAEPRSGEAKRGSESDWLNHAVEKVRENPGLFVYKLQSSAYKYSWLLIPISTPFVALLFLWRRRFGLYDHAVFATYFLSFMTLLVVLLTAVRLAGGGNAITTPVALIAPPLHMYKQLRGAYSLRRFSALWRTAALLVFALCALLLFGTVLLYQGLGH